MFGEHLDFPAERRRLRASIAGVAALWLILGPAAPRLPLGSETAAAQSVDPYIAVKATELGNDPAQIFAFVRDQIGFEAYRGSLRGARGTLWSRAGNALDKSTLLIALLNAAGVTQTRYAHGILDADHRTTLILSMFQEASRLRGCIPPGTGIYFPANDGLLSFDVGDHFWVELDTGGGFTAADPSFSGAQLGQTFTTADAHYDHLTDVPSGYVHTIRLRLDAELYNQATAAFALDGGLGTTTVFDQTLNAADVAGKPLSLGFLVDTNGGGAGPFTITTNTYTPYVLEGQVDADIASDPLRKGTTFQEVYTNFPLSSQIVTGLFLHVDVRDAYGTVTTYDRTLYDRIGYAARQGGGSIDVGALDPSPVTSDFDVTTINALPGRQSLDGFAAQRDRLGAVQQALAAIAPQVEALAPGGPFSPDQEALLQEASQLSRYLAIANSELATMAFDATSDRALDRLQAMYLNRAYAITPRLTLGLSRKAGDEATLELDLLKNDLRSVPYSGQSNQMPFRFEVARGLVESILEGKVLAAVSGQTTTSLADVLAAADASGDLAVITPLNSEDLEALPLSDEAKARIQSALANRRIVVTPTHMLDLNGTSTVGWIETDQTGHTISVFEHGGHQAIANYTGALEFSAAFNKPFANFIGRVTAFGQVGFLYASAVVSAISTGGGLDGTVADTKALIEQAVKQSEALNKVFEDMKKKFEKYKQDTTGFGFIGDMMEGFLAGMEQAKDIFTFFTPGDPEIFPFLVPAITPAAPHVTPGAQPGMVVTVDPDPTFTYPFEGAELPTVYLVHVQNTGPVFDRFNLGFQTLPPGFSGLLSVGQLGVAPGETGEVSLCLYPVAPIPTAGTPLSFSPSARSATVPGVFAEAPTNLGTPSILGVDLTIDPSPVATAPSTPVSVTLALRASGNQPVDVDVSLDLPPGLGVSGLTTPVTIPAGQVVTQQLTLTPSAAIVGGSELLAQVIAQFGPAGARQETRDGIVVRVLAPSSSCADPAATAARAIGRSGLADALTALGPAMSALAGNPTDSALRTRALALLDNVIFQMNAPLFATSQTAFQGARSQLAAAADAASVGAALDAIGTALCGLRGDLSRADASGMALTISPTSAIIQPQASTSFSVFLANQGSETRVFSIALGGLPAGISGNLSSPTVTLAPNQVTSTFNGPPLTVSLNPGSATSLAPFDVTVTATDQGAPSKSRSVTASLQVRDDLVSLVDIDLSPVFGPAGTVVGVVPRIYNAVNKARTVNVFIGVKNSANQYVVFPLFAGTQALAVGASIVDFSSAVTIPANIPDGPYQVEVSLTDASNGQALPNAVLTMPFFVGAPIGARIDVTPGTVAPGDSTVGVSLTIDRDSVPNPTATIVGALQTPGIAKDIVINGEVAYVCASTTIGIVDITDPTNPVLTGTFGDAQLAADFEVVGCQLDGNGHLLVGYAQTPNPSGTEFSVFDVSSPLNPSFIAHTSFSQRIGAKVEFTDGSFGFMTTSLFLYNPFSNFIFAQYGDLLSIDLSNPASPSVVGRLFPAGDPLAGGPNMIFGAAKGAGHIGLLTSTTATGDGFGTGPGQGRLLSVDVSSPTSPTDVQETLIPESVVLHGIGVDGGLALVAGDTFGFYDALSGFNGQLTLSTVDVSNPAAPAVQSTIVTHLGDKSGTPVIAMGNGVFAVAGSTTGNRSEIVLVDASNPASPRFIPYDLAVPILSMARSGNFFYAIGTDGLTVFELGSVNGPMVTARVDVPKGTGVAVVPGSFSLAPTDVVSGPTSDTYVWEQPAADTITWSETVSAMQVGEVRPVAVGGKLDFVVPTFGSGELLLSGASVAAQQILSIAPAVVNANVGDPASYTVTVSNPSAGSVTYALEVSGLPASWVQIAPSVQVPAGGSADVPLVVTSDANAPSFTAHDFSVDASGDDGVSGSVYATLNLQSPANLGGNTSRISHGAVLTIEPSDTTAGPGTTTTTIAHMTNVGDIDDGYYLQFIAGPNGWNGSVSPAFSVTVPSGLDNTRDVRLYATLPYFQGPGDFDLTVQLNSINFGALTTAVWHVHVPGVGVSVSLTPDFAPPSTTFHITVRNDGQGTDTFDLTAGGILGASAMLGSSKVTLAPGDNADIPVTLASLGAFLPANATLVATATSETNPAIHASATTHVTLGASKSVTAAFAPATVDLAAPGPATPLLQIANAGNADDSYTATITAVSGPLTAELMGFDGQPTQSISGIRLSAFAAGSLGFQSTLTASGEGQATVTLTSESDNSIAAQATVIVRTGTGPTPTPTPAVTPAPSGTPAGSPTATPAPTPTPGTGEDCFNCIDDDGDGLVDRDDPDCAPRADGHGVGLGDPSGRGKRIESCSRTIRGASVRYAQKVHQRLQRCTDAVMKCVQEQPASTTCVSKAAALCAKQVQLLGSGTSSDTAKLGSQIQKSCGASARSPGVAAADLLAPTGLGYSAEVASCATVGTPTLASLDDVIACVERAQRCRAIQSLGADAPRVAELLGIGSVASALTCPAGGADGAGVGLGDVARGKAADRCEKAIGLGGVKLVRSIAANLEQCTAAVSKCLQQKPADPSCLPKARTLCGKVAGRLGGGPSSAQEKFRQRLGKSCGVARATGLPLVPPADLLAATGLGYQAFETTCAALGAPMLGSIDDVADCLVRLHSCRAGQLLDNAQPRASELLGIGGIHAP